jgi:hypothetical protein
MTVDVKNVEVVVVCFSLLLHLPVGDENTEEKSSGV